MGAFSSETAASGIMGAAAGIIGVAAGRIRKAARSSDSLARNAALLLVLEANMTFAVEF